MDEEIKKAIISLENWLLDSHELGYKPNKIKYLNRFTDKDGIKCMIFKYKDNLFDNWCLAIVSDAGVFSEMKEYKKEDEIQDAKEMLRTLKNYWKAEVEKLEKNKRNEFEIIIKQFNDYKINGKQLGNWIVNNKDNIKLYDAVLFDEKDMENGKLKKGSKVLIRENVVYTSSEIMREIIKDTHICAPCSFEDLYNRISNEKIFIINPGSHNYGFKGDKELLKGILESK